MLAQYWVADTARGFRMYREFTQLEEIPDEYQFVEMEFSAIYGSLVAQDTKNVTLT